MPSSPQPSLASAPREILRFCGNRNAGSKTLMTCNGNSVSAHWDGLTDGSRLKAGAFPSRHCKKSIAVPASL